MLLLVLFVKAEYFLQRGHAMQVCNFKVEEKNHYRLVIDNEIDVPDEV